MTIGLIIAVEREMNAFLESGFAFTQETVCGRTVYHTERHGHPLAAILSGAGEIDAAAACQLLILHTGCDVVLNFGVAGALDPELRVEDLFLVEKVCHYDYDISPVTPVKKHQYEEYEDEFIPLDKELIRIAREAMPELKMVSVASGDRFVETREDRLTLAALGCGICEMEIAAVARVCLRSGVRCLSVKCISDTVEGTGADFWTNVDRSSRTAFRVLDRVIAAL